MRAPRCRPLAIALTLGLVAILSSHQAEATNSVARPAHYVEHGEASFYGPGFHGKRTASGVRFNQHGLTAAHPDLPLGSRVTVTNLENGRQVQVEINDRGPYVHDRVIDLSTAAAAEIGITIQNGVAPVRIEATAAQIAKGKSKPRKPPIRPVRK